MTERPKHYLLTPRGVERLRARIEEARSAYQAVCAGNPEAREAGDSSVWHDNFAFEENQRQMHQLGRKIRDLEEQLRRTEIVTPPAAPTVGAPGTRISYLLEGETQARCCILVGWNDGDPTAHRISYNSPLGSALVGSRLNEEREVVLAGRSRSLLILAIENAEDL